MDANLIGNLALIAIKTFNEERKRYYTSRIRKIMEKIDTLRTVSYHAKDQNEKGRLERELQLIAGEVIKESSND